MKMALPLPCDLAGAVSGAKVAVGCFASVLGGTWNAV